MFIYIIVVNVVAFFLYGIDKLKAKKNKWRIPERTLIGVAVVGGSLGALAGMLVWRHKTQHAKFYVGIPVIIVVQIALVVLLLVER